MSEINYIILILITTLFALNMGSSNFAVSFAAVCGGKILSKKWAQILFTIFCILGAVLLGKYVTKTISSKIIPQEIINLNICTTILASATFCLFLANLLHIPQSTSLVTVGAILGVGLYFKNVFVKTFLYLLPFWILLPVASFILTFFLGKLIYPPRKGNFWIYEKLVNHKNRLRTFVIIASCYNAFSVGTNNVANAVGPLVGAGVITNTLGLLLIAPIFGLGGLFFTGPLKTASEEIVPLGLLTASLICFVSGTLIITASILGIPQSFVMIKMASIFAVGSLKNGHQLTFGSRIMKKTYLTWIITPVIAVIISYLLTGGLYAVFK